MLQNGLQSKKSSYFSPGAVGTQHLPPHLCEGEYCHVWRNSPGLMKQPAEDHSAGYQESWDWTTRTHSIKFWENQVKFF